MFRSSQVLNSLHHHHGCRLASGFASLVGFCSMNAVKIPWQGTNMYTLYQSYNVDISTLFVTGRETFQAGIPASQKISVSSGRIVGTWILVFPGFTSSAIFGTIVGMPLFRQNFKPLKFSRNFCPTLDLRYVDKWGRKFGCIVYLIIEAHSWRRCIFFSGNLLGIMIHPAGWCNLFMIVAHCCMMLLCCSRS